MRKRPLYLSLVLYSHQLQPAIAHHIVACHTVYFWTWTAADLNQLQQNFEQYQQIAPGKQTLLGIYMWDFGGAKPISSDINLEAVEWSRGWIDQHADDVVRS